MLIKRAHKAPPRYGNNYSLGSSLYNSSNNLTTWYSFCPSLPCPAWQQPVPDSCTAQQR